jgi:hypothetical protein
MSANLSVPGITIQDPIGKLKKKFGFDDDLCAVRLLRRLPHARGAGR